MQMCALRRVEVKLSKCPADLGVEVVSDLELARKSAMHLVRMLIILHFQMLVPLTLQCLEYSKIFLMNPLHCGYTETPKWVLLKFFNI